MKTRTRVNVAKALTLIELLIVVAIVAVLLAMLFPVRSGPRKSNRLACMSNLRQIAIAFHLWAEDHNGRFPYQVPSSEGGTFEAVTSGSPAPCFQTLSGFVSRRVFACPTDKSRRPETNSSIALTDMNLSYFASVDASIPQTNAILSGDRHLTVIEQPGKPALLTLTTNANAKWTTELHKEREASPGGNLVFVDGHCTWSRTNLGSLIQSQGLATNRLAMP